MRIPNRIELQASSTGSNRSSLPISETVLMHHLQRFTPAKAFKGVISRCERALLESEHFKFAGKGLSTSTMVSFGTQLVAVRAHCFSSLKAKTTYTVYVMIKNDGDVVPAACNCIAGKGGACSHAAALLFFIGDIKRKKRLHFHQIERSGRLQQWHVPPKRNVAACDAHQVSEGSIWKDTSATATAHTMSHCS